MELSNKEKQTNDISLGIAYVRMAIIHFESAKASREVQKEGTSVVNEFINKLKYIDSRCKEKIKTVDPNNEMLTDEYAYKTGSIMHLSHQLSDEQRSIVEDLLTDMAMNNVTIIKKEDTFEQISNQ